MRFAITTILIKRTTSLFLQGGEEVAPNKCNIRSNVSNNNLIAINKKLKLLGA